MNKVIFMGRLTSKPEIREIGEKATKIANVRLAVPRNKDISDFINLVFWDKKAEIAEKYLDKGSRILVEGTLNIDSYEDQDKKTHYMTRVIVSNMEFCDSKKEFEQQEIPVI